MDRGTVERICVGIDIDCVWICCEMPPFAGLASSEFSLLSSPALRTLFGLLPLNAGDPAPPGPVELGRLSPTKLDIKLSSSLRLSARPGVGETSCLQSAHQSNPLDRCLRTSLAPPMLCLLAETSRARSSLWRFRSANFAFFANISSRRACILASYPEGSLPLNGQTQMLCLVG